MKGRKLFSILILFFIVTGTSNGADQNLLKCFHLLESTNTDLVGKATAYIQKSLLSGNLSEEQKAVVTQYAELGEFLSLDLLMQKKQLLEINKKFDIIRPCFTCKGKGITEKSKRCSECKLKGYCYHCRGQGYRYVRNGNVTSYEDCPDCEDGNCGVCKGVKYLDEECTKCDSVTGNRLDKFKLKNLIKKLYKEFEDAPEADVKLVEKVVEVKQVNSGIIDISIPQVLTKRNSYSGIFYKDREGLFIICYITDLVDPAGLRCLYDKKIIDHEEVSFSPKYQCFKLKLKENPGKVKNVQIGSYVNTSSFILNTVQNKNEFVKSSSNADIEKIYKSIGEAVIQERKVTGIFAREKVVNRENVALWFDQRRPYMRSEKFLPFSIDFVSSFAGMTKDDLNFDLLYLSQYLEWESSLLNKLESGSLDIVEQIDIDYLKDLKKSYAVNNWKTGWARVSSNRIIETITLLEKSIKK